MTDYKFLYLIFFGKEHPIGGMNDLKAICSNKSDADKAFEEIALNNEYSWGHMMMLNADTHSYGITSSWERGES